MFRRIPGHLETENGKLIVGGLDAEDLARQFGTPCYIYNANRILDNYSRILNALTKYSDREIRVHYAAKANTAIAILKLLSEAGAWVDVVSPFEAKVALDTGYSREKILFTGTSVSDSDLNALVELGVMINIDSFSQMRRLAGLGQFNVAIRWNPGEGAGYHDYVITAGKLIKFGIPEDRILKAFSEAIDLGFQPIGLHQHIGSGWLEQEVEIFLETVDKTLALAERVTAEIGHDLQFVDFGGGPGIPYKPGEPDFPVEKYARGICDKVKSSGLGFKAIAIEPGRYLVGDAGILLTEVNTVEDKGIPIIGVDAGFGTLIRPALYGSYHQFVISGKADHEPDREFMVAGNLCESGDIFHDPKKLRAMPTPDEGDILAILDAGAYGYSMASSYNMRPMPAEVMIQDGKARLIRERQTYNDLIAGQYE